ncbi:DNA polymerase III subunit gamma/tau [Oceanisphaera sp. KMM 10153]|uniref:DNA polymerase III subunit gamma/tau n=1 Tax=Oceanisphaera submarina TaxID=3390193 RepID=UPI0039751D1C
MSYQVLARKWRPRRFADVVGQQHVLTALVNALSQGRLHHAYLFSGTRGVGKTSIARLLAKALNCDTGITPEPCGQCASCLEIEQGRFIDLLEIDAASRTKVEDTRELLDNVQYQPARGRFKVYLIDEVHMLSRHSFNALLKTLEEPPPHVKFLLATTDPQKLPITILSRCLQFHLKSLEPALIDGQLHHILRQEKFSFEPEATAALARAADGSLRDALSLTDQALAFGNGAVRLDLVESMLGNLNRSQLLALVEAVLAGDGEALLARVAQLAAMGPDYDQIHKELIGFWHQLALAQVIPAAPSPYATELNRLAPLVSAEQIQLYYQICLQGRKDLPFAPDGRSALEMTLLRTLAFYPEAPVATTSGAAAPRLAAEVPGATAAKKPEPPASDVAPQDAMEDDAMAARLWQEQDDILTEAGRLGHASPPQPQPQPQELSSVPEAPVADEAVLSSPTASPTASNSTAPASEAKTTAAEPPAERPPAPLAAAPTPEAAAPLVSSPAVDTVTDEAAADVARIRRLLQTRNRLRSQSPEKTQGPEKTAVEPAKPAVRTLSAVPPSRSTAPVTPASIKSVPNQVQPDGLRPPMPEQGGGRPASRVMTGAEELPPLDAYEDMPWDDDDSPPWQDDSTAPGLMAVPTTQPAQSVSRPAGSLPQPTVAQGRAASAPNRPASAPPRPGSSRMRATAASSQSGSEPLKAASLLPEAEDEWTRLVAQLPLGGLLRQLAMHSTLECHENQWRLWLRSAHRHLLTEKTRQELEAAINGQQPAPVSLQVEIGEQGGETPFEIEQLLYQAATARAKDEIEGDDAVQFFISRFAAVLDTDSIEPMAL